VDGKAECVQFGFVVTAKSDNFAMHRHGSHIGAIKLHIVPFDDCARGLTFD